jgi:hypothetical protein
MLMPEMLTSPRFALPLLAAGQAQKEITHNEALLLIDAVVAAHVQAANAQTPPASPAAGQSWAIGNAPTGAWLGQAGRLAIATVGGWRFCAVPDGFVIKQGVAGTQWRRVGSGWAPAASVSPPTGGTVSDSEARAALTALIAALVEQGLLAPV